MNNEKLILGQDGICPVTKKHCDDECCPVGAICNLNGVEETDNVNNETKMLDAVRAMQNSARIFNAAIKDLSVILVEQIGSHTVVSTEFVLPKYWYVENCSEVTEWANKVDKRCIPNLDWKTDPLIASDPSDEKCPLRGITYTLNYTKITRDQFIQHVYNPWKAQQEKPKSTHEKLEATFGKIEDSQFLSKKLYWKFIGNPKQYEENLVHGMTYPHDKKFEFQLSTIGGLAQSNPSEWQPATESEYLAQEAAKQHEQGAPFDEVKTQRPNYDISNVTEPKFKVGDRVEALYDFPLSGVKKGEVGSVVDILLSGVRVQFEKVAMNLNYDLVKPCTPPKFDPAKADKTKMYFAVHPTYGEGGVSFDNNDWTFDNSRGWSFCDECTHIDHEPIQRRN